MGHLSLYDVDRIQHMQAPEEFQEVTTVSPAVAVFTDFKMHRPYMVEEHTRAIDAIELMVKAHVKMKIIVNGNDNFLGMVSLQNLSEDNIIKCVASGYKREEVLVKDLMIPKERIKAFSYQELERATVRDVIDTLQRYGYQHCLVVDHEKSTIRGLISASDIARKLHVSLSLHRPLSFAEIFSAISSAHVTRRRQAIS